VTGRLVSPGTPVSSTNKTDRHDLTEILLKVAINSIKQTKDEELDLLSLCWIPKLHICHYKQRYIAGSANEDYFQLINNYSISGQNRAGFSVVLTLVTPVMV
jgi:hypothetical protein